jgi:hypothetical protein
MTQNIEALEKITYHNLGTRRNAVGSNYPGIFQVSLTFIHVSQPTVLKRESGLRRISGRIPPTSAIMFDFRG